MDKLLELLEQLYNQTIDESAYCEDEMSWYFKDENALAQEVESLCDELLISDNGQCNWENIIILKNAGYRVYAGERDSFGWLTGCVQKKGDKRIIVYG